MCRTTSTRLVKDNCNGDFVLCLLISQDPPGTQDVIDNSDANNCLCNASAKFRMYENVELN